MGVILDICGILIDFETRYPDYFMTRCKNYLVDSADLKSIDRDVLVHINVSQQDIERSIQDSCTEMDAEFYALNFRLGEVLPNFGRLITHGVAIAYEGNSYIFTAKSGVGKSTHAYLWQRYFGADKVSVINGDKPILWFRDDEQILACGSPWSGKERFEQNLCLPLRGICLLQRLEDNPDATGPEIHLSNKKESLDFFIEQTFLPKDSQRLIKTFQLLERLWKNVPVYKLSADLSKECIRVSSNCLLGRSD